MPDWENLTLKELEKWVAYCMERPAPPAHVLASTGGHGDMASWRPSGSKSFETRRRPDSGVLELRFLEKKAGFSALEGESRLFENIAENEDKRTFRRVDASSDVILMEFESLIPDDELLPVIGPGGRITVAATASGDITADIVIRRRKGPRRSEWRPHADILDGLERQIAEAGGDVRRIDATFGYFELSKYWRQDWLRPAFLLSVTFAMDESDRAVRWNANFTEAATSMEGLSLTQGLVQWDSTGGNHE